MFLKSKKNDWHHPEQSIGLTCSDISGQSCSLVIGPALGVYRGVAPQINELLERHAEPMAQGEDKSTTTSWNMYMVGKSPSLARPTIVFASKSARQRRYAKALLNGSNILKEAPGVQVKTADKLPAEQTAESVFDSSSENEEDEDKNIYLLDKSENPSGVLISVGGRRLATLGGGVKIQDAYYGFTAQHAATRSLEHESEETEQSGPCTFDEDSDSDDEDFIEMTSRGSVSSESEYSEDLDSDLPSSSGLETLEHNQETQSSSGCSTNDIQTEDIPMTPLQIPAQLPQQPRHSRKLASYCQAHTNTDLDYMLFGLEREEPNKTTCMETKKFFGEDDFSSVSRAPLNVARSPAQRSVKALTGKSGMLKGTLFEAPFFIKFPQSSTFQELWGVKFEQDTVLGDSGALVTDAANGDLYGHIVARDLHMKLSFIVPAYKTAADIEARFGTVPSFMLLDQLSKPSSLESLPLIHGISEPVLRILDTQKICNIGMASRLPGFLNETKIEDVSNLLDIGRRAATAENRSSLKDLSRDEKFLGSPEFAPLFRKPSLGPTLCSSLLLFLYVLMLQLLGLVISLRARTSLVMTQSQNSLIARIKFGRLLWAFALPHLPLLGPAATRLRLYRISRIRSARLHSNALHKVSQRRRSRLWGPISLMNLAGNPITLINQATWNSGHATKQRQTMRSPHIWNSSSQVTNEGALGLWALHMALGSDHSTRIRNLFYALGCPGSLLTLYYRWMEIRSYSLRRPIRDVAHDSCPRSKDLYIGSIKAHVGHNKSVGGVTVLCRALRLRSTTWGRTKRCRPVLLNNFSAGGGNTRLVIEAQPDTSTATEHRSPRLYKSAAAAFKTWQVDKSTAAAPTFFQMFTPIYNLSFSDGGLVQNNPFHKLGEEISRFLMSGSNSKLQTQIPYTADSKNWVSDSKPRFISSIETQYSEPFDPIFFSRSANEVVSMSHQQRIILSATYEALESSEFLEDTLEQPNNYAMQLWENLGLFVVSTSESQGVCPDQDGCMIQSINQTAHEKWNRLERQFTYRVLRLIRGNRTTWHSLTMAWSELPSRSSLMNLIWLHKRRSNRLLVRHHLPRQVAQLIGQRRQDPARSHSKYSLLVKKQTTTRTTTRTITRRMTPIDNSKWHLRILEEDDTPYPIFDDLGPGLLHCRFCILVWHLPEMLDNLPDRKRLLLHFPIS